ncbi:MAG: hypothetical protein EHM81_09280 [Chloroflexi bacterium]|nr:MAG: hypothetical protein EHM81_09280 [Chloroflexota bacterium]
MNDRPGCLSGLLKLFLIDTVFDWAQKRFGFGRGGCCGCGCGLILLVFSCLLTLSVLFGTDWFHFSF